MEAQPSSKRIKTIFSFFKKTGQSNESICTNPEIEHPSVSTLMQVSPISSPEIEHPVVSIPELQSCTSIERDPGKRKQMFENPFNLRDEIRISYIKVGPYQSKLDEYPRIEGKKQARRFQKKWFDEFPWLEYSPSTGRAYCFYCFLFQKDDNSSGCSGLVTEGYNNWKRVKDGSKCAFLIHANSSYHKFCETRAKDLIRPSQHIDKVMQPVLEEELQKRRLRIMTSIKSVQWLAFQGLGFRGNDESPSSLNRGNFIQLIKYAADLNPEISEVVLENAPQNAQYIAPTFQKEILHIMANRVRRMIREEIGDECFCILVDEAQDASNREQMAIILRFVNKHGSLMERFFAIKRVSDTTSLNLKNNICGVLAQYELQVNKMRGQRYDGASNMRGAWNGLQALFLRDCEYAYYVHCFAYRLQLALVAAAKDVTVIWNFFSHLDKIVNIITSSPKRVTELQASHREEIQRMLAAGELESRKGSNQMVNLQRSGATRWSSHFNSVKSLIDMYGATRKVLQYICDHCSNGKSLAEARGAYKKLLLGRKSRNMASKMRIKLSFTASENSLLSHSL